MLDSRGPLQYDDRSIGGTSGVKGLPGGEGLEEDDANPWGDEDQVWALQEHVTKYKAQFDSVQKNGTILSSFQTLLLLSMNILPHTCNQSTRSLCRFCQWGRSQTNTHSHGFAYR